jgi:hypothetical protein
MVKVLALALFSYCIGFSFPIHAQKSSKFPVFEDVAAQSEEASRHVDYFKATKRVCRAIYQLLNEEIAKQAPKLRLVESRRNLEDCYEEMDNARLRFAPLATNIYRLDNYPNLLLEDGWTPEQIDTSADWIKKFASVWKQIKNIHESFPTDSEIEGLLRRSESYVSASFMASTCWPLIFIPRDNSLSVTLRCTVSLRL